MKWRFGKKNQVHGERGKCERQNKYQYFFALSSQTREDWKNGVGSTSNSLFFDSLQNQTRKMLYFSYTSHLFFTNIRL